jgi:hypothetical protein
VLALAHGGCSSELVTTPSTDDAASGAGGAAYVGSDGGQQIVQVWPAAALCSPPDPNSGGPLVAIIYIPSQDCVNRNCGEPCDPCVGTDACSPRTDQYACNYHVQCVPVE